MQSTSDREFVHSRLIDAPSERFFMAFADPLRLARWWGPNGFTSTFEIFEFRIGGRWRFVMHGPDGTDYPNESVFVEIVPSRKIKLEHLREFHHFFLTVTLTPVGDRTMVGWRQVFDTAEHRNQVTGFVREANEQNLDRLAAEVAKVG
jgi:uncharacterized protein YndB with AHSA1/START domain